MSTIEMAHQEAEAQAFFKRCTRIKRSLARAGGCGFETACEIYGEHRQPRVRYSWQKLPFAELWLPLEAESAERSHVIMKVLPPFAEEFRPEWNEQALVATLLERLQPYITDYLVQHEDRVLIARSYLRDHAPLPTK